MPSPTAPRRRGRPVALLLLAVLLLGGLLGGCARVRAALAVQPDDTVTGEIVVATPPKNADDRGPTITLPPELVGEVTVSPYAQDGYTGSLVRFSKLTFDQVNTLTKAIGSTNDPVQFQIRRAGGRVLVAGAVDLTTVPVDKADFQLKIGFPGSVVETNGESESGTVSWTFTPGEVGDLAATVAYADPNAPSVLNWTIGLAVVVAAVGAGVIVLARRTRNPPLVPPIR